MKNLLAYQSRITMYAVALSVIGVIACALSSGGIRESQAAPPVSVFAASSGDLEHAPLVQVDLSKPGRVLTLRNGSILICDTQRHRILIVFPSGRVNIFAGTGTEGIEIDPTDPRKTQLSFPSDLLELPNGNVVISDGSHARIIEIARNRKAIQDIQLPPTVWPAGLAFNPRDNTFLIANSGYNDVLQVPLREDYSFDVEELSRFADNGDWDSEDDSRFGVPYFVERSEDSSDGDPPQLDGPGTHDGMEVDEQ